MCGIAGFVGKGSEDYLGRMINSIRYRGPDFQGTLFSENVGLAHARLSIIDLSPDARQPFFSADKSLVIVFNGEIYNYGSLKKDLMRLGKYTFRTNSDTEVLLYLYQEYGVKCFDMVNGMFAFAIYDFTKKQLLLARDRMGKKPLYYSVINGTMIFASELKAILRHPSIIKELNLDAVNEYLTFDYIPTPHTIFKNINKLEASQYIIFGDGKIISKKAYWSADFHEQKISFSEAVTTLDVLLNNAVSCRLMSDVPLGVFLSGGLDSSTVAYYAQKGASSQINTFSIGFSEKSYDESNYAELVAKQLGTCHHYGILSANTSLDLIPEITSKLDEPFADPSIIPTYFLSKFTRKHVTVALGGDGSDELLAGYPTFISDRFLKAFSLLPKPLMKSFSNLTNLLPPSDKNISLDFKLVQFFKGFEEENQYIHTLWLGSFIPSLKTKLFTSVARGKITNHNGLECIDKYLEDVPNADRFNRLLYSYYRTYLLEDILVKVDRASMYNSLEVRAPFLDVNVVEFLNSLPKSYKIRWLSGKYILKELIRNKLPDEIIDRPKKGFGIPVSLWLRNELKEKMEYYLSEERIRKHGIFEHSYINRLKQEHLELKHNHRKLLWNLLIFEMWWDNFM
ncbi:MAG: asparagine synthase (glutamine-hydrolyzing) [Bacteroidia bacterium]